MICICDPLGDELAVDHLAGEDFPRGVFSHLVLRHQDPSTRTDHYECPTCHRWYRVVSYIDHAIQTHEDCTRITRLTAEAAGAELARR